MFFPFGSVNVLVKNALHKICKDEGLISNQQLAHMYARVHAHTHTRAPNPALKISCSAFVNYLHKNGGQTIVHSTEYEDITGPPNPEV